jgi:hypothetical protein
MPDNGLVERFNGRVQREVLGITIYSHRDLEMLLKGFNQAYNRRRQRVLKGRSPDEVVRSRLAVEPTLANQRSTPPDPHALPEAIQVVAHAKEVSHPDIYARVDPGYCKGGPGVVKAHGPIKSRLSFPREAPERGAGSFQAENLTGPSAPPPDVPGVPALDRQVFGREFDDSALGGRLTDVSFD